jgi:hypothetical protein
MRVGTWNVRSLYRAGAYKELMREVERYELDIVAIQESRWTGQGEISGGKHILYYGGADKHSLGTGFVINKKLVPAICDVQFVNDRLSFLVMRGKWYKYIFINVHCPTEEKEDDIKDEFYEELELIFDKFSTYDVKVVLGDFNAKIGREEIFRPTVGLESLHDSSNDNGVRAINFATSKNLIVKSTCFKHKDIHKATWVAPNSTTRNQIDHIMIDKRRHTNILDVRSFRGADCGSDHFLVVSRIRDRLAVSKSKQRAPLVKKFDVERLKVPGERERYQVEITNRFTELESLENDESGENGELPEKMWTDIRGIILGAAKTSLGYQRRKKSKPWYDDECVEWSKKRGEARIQSLTASDDNRDERNEQLQKISKEYKRLVRRKKREWEKEKIVEIEDNRRQKNVREMYKGINSTKKGFQSKSNTVRDEKGDLIADRDGLLGRWKRYFDQLLNVHRNQGNNESSDDTNTDEREVDEPSLEEVWQAVKRLKNNKAAGVDEIPSELIKNGGAALISKIHKLICAIWNREVLPEEWKEAIIVPIFKKGDKTDCNNYRGISLLPTCYKVLSNVLVARMTPYAEEIIGDYQCGFRRNRSTSDQMFSLRQILEKKWEFCGVVHQLFIDFKKAYDSIIRCKLYQILVSLGVPKKLVKLVQVCLNGHRGRVRVGGDLSDPFDILNGLKQGDALSSVLFNLALEYVVRSIIENREGLSMNGIIQLLAYADDIDLLGDSREIVRRNAELLKKAGEEVGLEFSEEKTKYMLVDRLGEELDVSDLEVDNMIFEKVSIFKYLGGLLEDRKDMGIGAEIKQRLNSGNACFYALNKLLKSRDLSRNTKLRIYKTIILPVVLYGCETWALTRQQENRFRVFENKILRKIFGAKRDEETGEYRRLHNQELEELFDSPSIIRVMKARRTRWAGHVARMGEERVARKILEGKPEGKRPLGRPRQRWEDNVKRDIFEVESDQVSWRELAQNREDWRACVNAVIMNFRVS